MCVYYDPQVQIIQSGGILQTAQTCEESMLVSYVQCSEGITLITLPYNPSNQYIFILMITLIITLLTHTYVHNNRLLPAE